MTACPKCGSTSIYQADDEWPVWALNWMACLTCGKRWDQAGGAAPPEDAEKEGTMEKCTKGQCPDEAAPDSVRCPKHRDMQRASNARFQKRGSPKRAYTRRRPPAETPATPGGPAEIWTPGAKPARAVDLNGNALTLFDALIKQREEELVTLRRAREIVEARR